MKSIITSTFLAIVFLSACNNRENAVVKPTEDIWPAKAAGYTIYEVNIRQYTPEGTFNAFAKNLPRLKDLGVDMLWFMPIHPIGEKNRKEPLGSYYSVKDYKGVNPEFGSAEDFKNLVKQAHNLGMGIILDWVPNHSSYDNIWITEHPEFYVRDQDGNIMHEADWTDIALLDHTKQGTREAMIDAMKYWVTEFDIDGFRCDHAGHEIPLYFWEEVRDELGKIKDLLWLAEWDGARMHLQFDLTYAWELLHITEDVGTGKKTADDVASWIERDTKEYGRKPFRMTMITNHDENSWSGTMFEKFGEGHKTFATFIFTAYGIPMIYSGQEAGLAKRLKFFEKDNISWKDSLGLQPFYKQLTTLKKQNKALYAGEYGGPVVRINQGPEIFAFSRTKDENTVIGILNFTGKEQEFKLTDANSSGTYKDYFTGKEYTIGTSESLKMSPWQYLVFIKN
ncbi:MAG: alpha-amylase family glycosyl hydrolase [Cyclobacteriaceae bacterium]